MKLEIIFICELVKVTSFSLSPPCWRVGVGADETLVHQLLQFQLQILQLNWCHPVGCLIHRRGAQHHLDVELYILLWGQSRRSSRNTSENSLTIEISRKSASTSGFATT